MFNYILIFLLASYASLTAREPLILTGYDLTIEKIAKASSQNDIEIIIDSETWERVKSSHELILESAKEDIAVYGLNRGVGLNKDKKIFNGDVLSQEAKQASVDFNKKNLYATSAAVGEELPEKVVKAIMVVKLNSILQGSTGAHPRIAEILQAFINKGITPILPSRGSIGEADITILSHLGLTLMGEGDVYYQGRRLSALKAMEENQITPLIPYAKDSLSIMSSNAYSVAIGALLIHDVEHLLNKVDVIFALSLEALNGNIAPFLEESQKARPYPGQMESAVNVRRALKGSFLWETSSERELQDPLSFRNASQVHGTARDLMNSAKKKLEIHINSSDDNPLTLLEPSTSISTAQEAAFYLKNGKGAVIPTANFDPINWIIDFEALGIALTHLSQTSTQRIIRLSTDKFTHLSRFLSPDPKSLIFSAIQKTFVSLNSEIRSLSHPVSFDSLPVAGEIEDHATNAPLVLNRLCKMVDNLYYIYGFELLHNTQAIDLRKKANPDLKIGCITKSIYTAYREQVPFVQYDRPLSNDIEKGHDFVSSFWNKNLLTPSCLFKADTQR